MILGVERIVEGMGYCSFIGTPAASYYMVSGRVDILQPRVFNNSCIPPRFSVFIQKGASSSDISKSKIHTVPPSKIKLSALISPLTPHDVSA